MARWRLRIRSQLAGRATGVAAALVVLALVGAGLTYATFGAPGTTTRTVTASTWQTTGQFDGSATVTRENPVYPVGTVLENRSVYLLAIDPWYNGTYRFSYQASQRGDLDAAVTLQLVLRGVEPNGQEKTVIWQTSRRIGAATAASLHPGESVVVPFAIDVNDTVHRVDAIEAQLGNPPGSPAVLLLGTVSVRGTVDGQPVERVDHQTVSIALGSSTFRPQDTGPVTHRYQTRRRVTVARTYGALRRVGGPLLFGLSLLGLVGLVVAGNRGRLDLSANERARLTYEEDRRTFDEWISTISLPDAAREFPVAEATSLGDLVDFAINTDNGVMEDPDDGAYYVLHDDVCYRYSPPGTTTDVGPDRDATPRRDDASTGADGTVHGPDAPGETSGEAGPGDD